MATADEPGQKSNSRFFMYLPHVIIPLLDRALILFIGLFFAFVCIGAAGLLIGAGVLDENPRYTVVTDRGQGIESRTPTNLEVFVREHPLKSLVIGVVWLAFLTGGLGAFLAALFPSNNVLVYAIKKLPSGSTATKTLLLIILFALIALFTLATVGNLLK